MVSSYYEVHNRALYDDRKMSGNYGPHSSSRLITRVSKSSPKLAKIAVIPEMAEKVRLTITRQQWARNRDSNESSQKHEENWRKIKKTTKCFDFS
jgi:hypothetical protein